MSKITFRADDDLISQLEEYDASKSEVMREALRAYLGESEGVRAERDQSTAQVTDTETIDELIADRVDAIISERLDETMSRREPQDVNVNITLDGETAANATGASDADADASHEADADVSHSSGVRKTDAEARETVEPTEQKTCAQCGEGLSDSHVYCPNCGEKASRRVFCDCGDELRSDWGFCPSCGRRTPAADVLDQT